MDTLSFSFNSSSLSSHEQTCLSIGVLKLIKDEKLNNTPSFWGKIVGTAADYVILANTKSSFGQIIKNYYIYNNNLNIFEILLPPSQKSMNNSPNINTLFTGDITNVYKLSEKPQLDGEEVDSLPELDRLSYVVYTIDSECSLIPSNSVYLSASKEILPNPEYKGLSSNISKSLDSYRHYRDSNNSDIRERLANTLYHSKNDFLDNISNDKPNGIWSIKNDENLKYTTVSSFLWPGYHFVNEINTTRYAGAYFGNGLRQNDVAFLL